MSEKHKTTANYQQKDQKTLKTSTSILCELTRLKSQQKYLECSQIKLNPENFDEADIKNTICDIEDCKLNVDQALHNYRTTIKRDIEEMWVFINAIKVDIFNTGNLQNCTMNGLRERIIGINTQIQKLNEKNQRYFHELREASKNLELDTKFLLK